MSDIPVRSRLGGNHAYPAPDFPDPGFPDQDFPPPDEADLSTVDLSSDPFKDDLNAELAAAAPKRWVNRATYAVAALALLVGGFLAGVQVEKHYGTPTSAVGAAGARRGAGGLGRGGTGITGTGGNGGVPGGAGGSGATGGTTAGDTETGTIRLVDGLTIYIALANGNVLTVRTNASTKVSVGSVTTVKGLKAGQKITVTGTDATSGDVIATSVTAAS